MKKIHETAEIGEQALIGDDTVIWQHCVVQDEVTIGQNCVIGANVFIENGVRIGNNVTIKNNIAVYTGVIIEDDVFLGPNCVFTNVINPRSFIDRKHEFKKTLVRRGATIGANATVVCGRMIGQYAMIGAGSVVTKDVMDYSLVYGNPAKHRGYVCKCGCRLNGKYECAICGAQYELLEGRIIGKERM
ncbi:MAG: acetyltransferase [Lachnospiraceae bacterium]|nr:acetyltransferase [Lachnospiraceae bacterium]